VEPAYVKRKPGRPALPEDRRRSIPFEVRLSPREYAQIKANADAAEMAMGEYVRQRALTPVRQRRSTDGQ
jgi:predicted HicB family RNase H-like nuclease